MINRKSVTACGDLYRKLENLPGFITVGVGAEALIVYATDPDAIKGQIPAAFNGFDVVVKQSGKPFPA